MRYAVLLVLVGLVASPAFGSDCFCMMDEDDQLWFDCREQKRPSGIHIFCAHRKTQEQIELTERKDLSRVPDGEPPCTPCRLDEVVDIDPPLRGD